MDNDLSWMGLFKKGYKLQCYFSRRWIPIKGMTGICYAIKFKLPIRYKHSIQS